MNTVLSYIQQLRNYHSVGYGTLAKLILILIGDTLANAVNATIIGINHPSYTPGIFPFSCLTLLCLIATLDLMRVATGVITAVKTLSITGVAIVQSSFGVTQLASTSFTALPQQQIRNQLGISLFSQIPSI